MTIRVGKTTTIRLGRDWKPRPSQAPVKITTPKASSRCATCVRVR